MMLWSVAVSGVMTVMLPTVPDLRENKEDEENGHGK